MAKRDTKFVWVDYSSSSMLLSNGFRPTSAEVIRWDISSKSSIALSKEAACRFLSTICFVLLIDANLWLRSLGLSCSPRKLINQSSSTVFPHSGARNFAARMMSEFRCLNLTRPSFILVAWIEPGFQISNGICKWCLMSMRSVVLLAAFSLKIKYHQ